MNRRGFFSTLAKVGTGVLVAPSLFIPKEKDRFRWRAPRWKINSEWQDAKYEISYLSYGPKIYFGPLPAYSEDDEIRFELQNGQWEILHPS